MGPQHIEFYFLTWVVATLMANLLLCFKTVSTHFYVFSGIGISQ